MASYLQNMSEEEALRLRALLLDPPWLDGRSEDNDVEERWTELFSQVRESGDPRLVPALRHLQDHAPLWCRLADQRALTEMYTYRPLTPLIIAGAGRAIEHLSAGPAVAEGSEWPRPETWPPGVAELHDLCPARRELGRLGSVVGRVEPEDGPPERLRLSLDTSALEPHHVGARGWASVRRLHLPRIPSAQLELCQALLCDPAVAALEWVDGVPVPLVPAIAASGPMWRLVGVDGRAAHRLGWSRVLADLRRLPRFSALHVAAYELDDLGILDGLWEVVDGLDLILSVTRGAPPWEALWAQVSGSSAASLTVLWGGGGGRRHLPEELVPTAAQALEIGHEGGARWSSVELRVAARASFGDLLIATHGLPAASIRRFSWLGEGLPHDVALAVEEALSPLDLAQRPRLPSPRHTRPALPGAELSAPLEAALAEPMNPEAATAAHIVGGLMLLDRGAALVRLVEESPVEHVQVCAAEALGWLGDAGHAPALIAALDRPAMRDPKARRLLRRALVDTLAILGDASAAPTLRRIYAEGDVYDKRSAVAALGRLGSAEDLPWIWAHVEAEDLYPKRRALLAALCVGGPAAPIRPRAAAERLAQALVDWPDRDGAAALMASLEHFAGQLYGDPDAWEPLARTIVELSRREIARSSARLLDPTPRASELRHWARCMTATGAAWGRTLRDPRDPRDRE